MGIFNIEVEEQEPNDGYDLTWEDVNSTPGFYQVRGREDALFLTTDDKDGSRTPVTLRVDRGPYVASGWSGSKFRRVNRTVTIGD